MYFGAFVSAVVGYQLLMPRGVHIVVCLLVAGLSGMIFSFIPAILKLLLDVNELISTLMLNYAALLFTEYLTFKYMGFDASELADAIATPDMQPTGPPVGAPAAHERDDGDLHRHRHRDPGAPALQVHRQGVRAQDGRREPQVFQVRRRQLQEHLPDDLPAQRVHCGHVRRHRNDGTFGKFRPGFATNLGWDGVMIASIAKNNPIAVIFISFIWGALKSGSFHMERVTETNRLVISVLQALFVLLVAIDYEALYKWFCDQKQLRMLRKQESGVQ